MAGVIVVGAGEGDVVESSSGVAHIKVDVEGLYLSETTSGPMPMIDLHVHRNHSDAFYVLDGEIEVATSATDSLRLGAGGFAVAPPGAPHAFAVPERARFLNIHAPGMAFGTYMRGLVGFRERGEAPTPEFFARFDIHPPA
ncbi:MAG: cupin domain-containing protein [Actinomycetota bacterium]